jgi:serine/threonine protein kinase
MEQYVIVKRIAEAIYGEVLLCRHVPTNTYVAMKKVNMSAAYAQTSEAHGHAVKENILVELDMNQALQDAGGHAHVCRFREHFFFEQDKIPMLAIVFDYCPNGELLSTLSTKKRFTDAEALRYLSQIGLALQFLHRNNIAHRDISLENILLDTNNNCNVCDFGLACNAACFTNASVGKTLYMSPEAVARQWYAPVQADMWSLGIALFTMIVGHYPFHEASMYDPFFQAYSRVGLQYLLQKHNATHFISQDIQTLLTHLMDIDPRGRWDIETLLAHPIVAPYVEKQKHQDDYDPYDDASSLSYVSIQSFSTDSRKENEVGAHNMRASCHFLDSSLLVPSSLQKRQRPPTIIKRLKTRERDATPAVSTLTMSIRSPEIVQMGGPTMITPPHPTPHPPPHQSQQPFPCACARSDADEEPRHVYSPEKRKSALSFFKTFFYHRLARLRYRVREGYLHDHSHDSKNDLHVATSAA